MQRTSEAAVDKIFAQEESKSRGAQAALVLLTREGAVRAMVGGRDYASSEFNRAASARRQLGSAFKPFVFAAAFEAGVSAGADVLDAPLTIRTASGPWSAAKLLAPVSRVDSAVRGLGALKQRCGGAPLAARRASIMSWLWRSAPVSTIIFPPFPSLALGVIENQSA